jgi:hypothetical protein
MAEFEHDEINDLVDELNKQAQEMEVRTHEEPILIDIGNGNGKSNQNGKAKRKKKQKDDEDEQTKKEVFLERYVADGSIAEAVIIAGIPKFAVAVPGEVSITLHDAIEIDDTIIRPLESMSYMDKPYRFGSTEGFEQLVENIRTKDLDALYKTVKSVWKKYIDADDFHISLCAADTVFTYFQDKIGLTHYLFFIGGNTSGKSNNITVLHYLAYRNMMDSGMTAPNVYTFLGSGEEGIGTICEDEADNIDQDFERMKVYKNGYTTGKPYHRIDTSFGGRKQGRFNTFCFKAFAAEELPDSVTAKGFNQRIIELPCVYGFPAHDISEVANPAGEEEYEELLQELHQVRNSLLIYRLLHFHEKIPDLNLNIQNREKQLFKPMLRVFQNTLTFNELLPVISKYVNQRRQSNADTLHAWLYRLVRDLIKAQDTYELESGLIWNTVKETLQGKDIPYKPQSYDTVEFGIISQKGIIETLQHVFGAKPTKRHSGRSLIFDQNKLERLSRIYDLSIDVKVGPLLSTGVADVADVAHVGLDKHLQEQYEDKEIGTSEHKNTNISNENTVNNEKIISQAEIKISQASVDVPQAPHVPPDEERKLLQHTSELSNNAIDEYSTKLLLGQGAYWSGSRWNCKSCNYSYDGPGMIQHLRLEHNKQRQQQKETTHT